MKTSIFDGYSDLQILPVLHSLLYIHDNRCPSLPTHFGPFTTATVPSFYTGTIGYEKRAKILLVRGRWLFVQGSQLKPESWAGP